MITNLIVLITGLIGFLTTGLILKNHKLNNVMNIYFVLIILLISTRFFLSGLIHFELNNALKYYYLRYSNLSLFVIPLVYLYFKNLSNNIKAFEKKELLHFIFPVSFFLFIINVKNYDGINKIHHSIFTLYIAFSIFIIYKLLKRNIWAKKNLIVFRKQNILNSKWSYYFFLSIITIVVCLLVSTYFELYSGSKISGFSFQWVAGIIWLSIFFKILVSPEILYGYDVLHKKIDENRYENLILNSIWDVNPKIQINNTQHLQLKEKIDLNILSYIEEIEKNTISGKIFREPSITMADLASKLNIPKSHISYLFKYHSTISFSDYKKTVRIQDAIKLINDDYLKETTLEYLSKKVGFSSYNTFFTSFKEISGISPLEYCKADRR